MRSLEINVRNIANDYKLRFYDFQFYKLSVILAPQQTTVNPPLRNVEINVLSRLFIAMIDANLTR